MLVIFLKAQPQSELDHLVRLDTIHLMICNIHHRVHVPDLKPKSFASLRSRALSESDRNTNKTNERTPAIDVDYLVC